MNLRESLNKIDSKTNNKYDLLNLYETANLSIEQKKVLFEMLSNEEITNEEIYDYLNEGFLADATAIGSSKLKNLFIDAKDKAKETASSIKTNLKAGALGYGDLPKDVKQAIAKERDNIKAAKKLEKASKATVDTKSVQSFKKDNKTGNTIFPDNIKKKVTDLSKSGKEYTAKSKDENPAMSALFNGKENKLTYLGTVKDKKGNTMYQYLGDNGIYTTYDQLTNFRGNSAIVKGNVNRQANAIRSEKANESLNESYKQEYSIRQASDVLESMLNNASDKEINKTIFLFKKYARVLKSSLNTMSVITGADYEILPSENEFEKSADVSIYSKLYDCNGIDVIEEEFNNNHFLYFKNEDEAEKYLDMLDKEETDYVDESLNENKESSFIEDKRNVLNYIKSLTFKNKDGYDDGQTFGYFDIDVWSSRVSFGSAWKPHTCMHIQIDYKDKTIFHANDIENSEELESVKHDAFKKIRYVTESIKESKLNEDYYHRIISKMKDEVLDILQDMIDLDMYKFPKKEFLADSWEDLRDGLIEGVDDVLDTADGLKNYIEKHIKFDTEYDVDNPLVDDEIDWYNRLDKLFGELDKVYLNQDITEAFDSHFIQSLNQQVHQIYKEETNKMKRAEKCADLIDSMEVGDRVSFQDWDKKENSYRILTAKRIDLKERPFQILELSNALLSNEEMKSEIRNSVYHYGYRPVFS